MSASHFGLDGLVALVDCNGIQADGPVVLNIEPVADKWRSFGWDVTEINGNDMKGIVGALMLARAQNGKPKAIILRTQPGKGVARIESSEKSHFFRVDPKEWDGIIAEFEHRHVFADFPQSAQGNNSQFWFCHKRKLPARMTITRQVSLSV